jgi:hypothetical protein
VISTKRRVRDQYDHAGGDQGKEVADVEPGRFLDLVVERMRPAENFAESPGTGERDADCAQQTGVEQADCQEGACVIVLVRHHHLGGLCGVVNVHAAQRRTGDERR